MQITTDNLSFFHTIPSLSVPDSWPSALAISPGFSMDIYIDRTLTTENVAAYGEEGSASCLRECIVPVLSGALSSQREQKLP